MKTKQLHKLNCCSIIIMLYGIGLFAQTSQPVKDTFIRVFNLNGKKVAKGCIYGINDTILTITKNKNELMELSVFDIGKIKTKRSTGHNVLVGAAAGVTLGAVIGAASRDDSYWSEGETVLISGTVFGVLGTAIGAITGAAKDKKTFVIDGDLEKLKNAVAIIKTEKKK